MKKGLRAHATLVVSDQRVQVILKPSPGWTSLCTQAWSDQVPYEYHISLCYDWDCTPEEVSEAMKDFDGWDMKLKINRVSYNLNCGKHNTTLRAIYCLALEITPATTDTQTQTHKKLETSYRAVQGHTHTHTQHPAAQSLYPRAPVKCRSTFNDVAFVQRSYMNPWQIMARAICFQSPLTNTK